MKLTKRKQFKFYRSYFDVYNELSNKDKVIFMDALLDKQFLNKDPEGLNGILKIVWASLYHSIDTQVKGYETKTGNILNTNNQEVKDPIKGGSVGAMQGACLQEEEKEKEKEQLIIYNIVDYLNKKTNSYYRPTSKKTISFIKSRLNEKFTEYDFKKVIDIKSKEWLNTDMSKYLRPETLFGNKFESYLNQGNNTNNGFTHVKYKFLGTGETITVTIEQYDKIKDRIKNDQFSIEPTYIKL
jgi:uncharacterized phage protein (TIGR02220 family)